MVSEPTADEDAGRRSARPFSTERLMLIPIDERLARIEARTPHLLPAALQCEFPADWKAPYPSPDMEKSADVLSDHPELAGLGGWHMIRMSDRKLVGRIGVNEVCYLRTVYMVGYEVFKEFQKQGFATEAVLALRDWALIDPEVTWLIAEADDDNPASKRVMEKVGMSRLNGLDEGFVRFGSPNGAASEEARAGIEFPTVDLAPFSFDKNYRTRRAILEHVRSRAGAFAMAAGILALGLHSGQVETPLLWLVAAAVPLAVLWEAIAKVLQAEKSRREFMVEIHRLSLTSQGLVWGTDRRHSSLVPWKHVIFVKPHLTGVRVAFKKINYDIPNSAFTKPGLRDRFLTALEKGGVHVYPLAS